KAVAVYKHALKLDPSLIDVHAKLADLYHLLGLMQDAMVEYKTVAEFYECAGLQQEHLAALKKVIDICPTAPSHVALAEAYLKYGETEDAVRKFAHAARMSFDQNSRGDWEVLNQRISALDPAAIDRPTWARIFIDMRAHGLDPLADESHERYAEKHPERKRMIWMGLDPNSDADTEQYMGHGSLIDEMRDPVTGELPGPPERVAEAVAREMDEGERTRATLGFDEVLSLARDNRHTEAAALMTSLVKQGVVEPEDLAQLVGTLTSLDSLRTLLVRAARETPTRPLRDVLEEIGLSDLLDKDV
ncbi:MAG: tetratricopeptide repeat protein, partial [Candidatus Uhrbacteria bacterium]